MKCPLGISHFLEEISSLSHSVVFLCFLCFSSSGGATPHPKARGGGREELPHVQGAVIAWAQEGLEELFHIQGQEGQQ